MMRDDFGVIIISHGRPECRTVATLLECGYTGKYYIVLDDEDDMCSEYISAHGLTRLHFFHKQVNFDIMDNFDGPNSIATFARNECWNVAQKNKLKYFLMLDDDLKSVSIRYKDGRSLRGQKVQDIDRIFSAFCDFMDSAPISCCGFGLPIDYIGGEFGRDERHIMNAYFLRTSDRFDFRGRYSEDTITPIAESNNGKIFQKVQNVQMTFDVWLPEKKAKTGGCQDAYKNNDSFVLRFYAVMSAPSCVVIRPSKNVGWDNTTKYDLAFPKVVSERFRKK